METSCCSSSSYERCRRVVVPYGIYEYAETNGRHNRGAIAVGSGPGKNTHTHKINPTDTPTLHGWWLMKTLLESVPRYIHYLEVCL